MFKKVLVANRGEIAVRVIRACRELGIRTVAVYSEADRESLHVQMADEAVCIGPAPSKESYLNLAHIVSAALITGAEAVHPGYGFLAENPTFAEACTRSGLKFIGPPPEAMRALGDKATARRIAVEAGVPVVPGTEGEVNSEAEALKVAREIGFPVMIKAADGGGGKGLRVVRDEVDLRRKFKMASEEAEKAFGSRRVYLEKYIERPRHVEVQILADSEGKVVHLFERECSIQTTGHQKLVEEAPSPAVTPELRERLGEYAVRLAEAVGYENAGTFEFILDREGNPYFIEANTRIQVEHPVTEMVTGVDLVKAQILIAAGEALWFDQGDLTINGWAIECRINAQDPARDFSPQAGKVKRLLLPGGPGVRVDTHLYEGYEVPPFYDALLAKVVAWGRDRMEAISRMRRALRELTVEGLKTTREFHLMVMEDEEFVRGQVDTGFYERRIKPRIEAA